MAKEGAARSLNENDIQKMLCHLANSRHSERDTAIFLLTLRAGMRIGSVAGLTLEDVLTAEGDLKEVVVLRRSITKGQKTLRAFLSNEQLREALLAYLAVRPAYKASELFISQKGTRFSANSLSQLMLKHYQAAGIDGASSHSGRRTAITSWIKKGGDIVAVSKLAGHSSILTTQKYVHHNEEELISLCQ